MAFIKSLGEDVVAFAISMTALAAVELVKTPIERRQVQLQLKNYLTENKLLTAKKYVKGSAVFTQHWKGLSANIYHSFISNYFYMKLYPSALNTIGSKQIADETGNRTVSLLMHFQAAVIGSFMALIPTYHSDKLRTLVLASPAHEDTNAYVGFRKSFRKGFQTGFKFMHRGFVFAYVKTVIQRIMVLLYGANAEINPTSLAIFGSIFCFVSYPMDTLLRKIQVEGMAPYNQPKGVKEVLKANIFKNNFNGFHYYVLKTIVAFLPLLFLANKDSFRHGHVDPPIVKTKPYHKKFETQDVVNVSYQKDEDAPPSSISSHPNVLVVQDKTNQK